MSSLFSDVAWNSLVVDGEWGGGETGKRRDKGKKFTTLYCTTYQKRTDLCLCYIVPDIKEMVYVAGV
jgi:hypothetical protein